MSQSWSSKFMLLFFYFLFLFIYLFIYLFICLFVCLFVYLFICLFIYLFIYLFIFCLLACLIFSPSFLRTCLSKYTWKDVRHNKTLCTTDFFNSVLCLVSCSSINQASYFILNKFVMDPNLICLLLGEKKTLKKKCIYIRSSNLSQALRHRSFSFSLSR